jgi:hypothetical protein
MVGLVIIRARHSAKIRAKSLIVSEKAALIIAHLCSEITVFDRNSIRSFRRSIRYSTIEACCSFLLNSSPAIMPLAALYFWGHFLMGHISLKNGTFCPLFSHETTIFKSTCHLIRLKVLPDGLYGAHLHCELGQ